MICRISVLSDELHVRGAKKAGRKTGPLPVDRSRSGGSKHHVIREAQGMGIPLAVTLTAANCNDITELIPLVDRVPPTGRYGKPRVVLRLAIRGVMPHLSSARWRRLS